MELLESRWTPAFDVGVVDGSVTFNGGDSDDSLTLSVTASGLLRHNLALAGNLASVTDMDSVKPGVQSILLASVTSMYVYAGSGDDFINASVMNIGILMYGGPGNDTLRGGSGNDDLRGGDGDDTLEGNGGNDALDWNDGGQSGGNDILRGGDEDDFLAGQADDQFYGGAGSDRVSAGELASLTLTDTTYTSGTFVSVNHGVESWAWQGTAGNDVFNASAWTGAGILMYGFGGNDTLRGGAGNDDLRGGDGDDTLDGNGGNDALDWNDGGQRGGSDILRGGDGDDYLAGQASDQFYGGAGSDRVSADELTSLTLTDTTYTSGTFVSVNHGVESWTWQGTAGNDVFNASAWTGAGILMYGYGGNDTLRGGSGNDDLRGGDGDDTLEGNGGNDSLDWQDYGQSGGNDVLRGGDDDDSLTGQAGDQFYGGAGSDRVSADGLTSLTLTDTTYTSGTFVSVNHGVESWTWQGTAGNDVFNASAWTGAGTLMYGYGGNDTLRGGSGNDDLRGGDGDDTLEGNGGNDALDWNDGGQRGGSDILRGGDGDDLLAGQASDQFYGGAGSDRVSADELTALTLTDTTYTSGTFVSLNHGVESWTWQGTVGNDVFNASTWTGAGLTIFGGAGNDTLLGGSGADDLRGDAGDDVLEGNGGNDTIRGDSNGGGYSSGNDTLRGGAGNDTLYGDSDADGGNGNDILDGGDGDDSLFGFDGNDTFNGGAGTDGFWDNVATDATLTDSNYTANGVTSFGHGLEAGVLYGSAAANRIDASAWTKSNLGIYGGAGNDTILGGAGADDLRGDAGDDVLEGNGGNDTIRGDSYGGGYSSGNDTLRGGAGNDTLYGDSDADGGNGNDILDGGDGDDSLFGFDGNDTFNGGAGTDGFWDNVATDATLTDSNYTANGVTSFGHGLEGGTLYGSAAANRIDASAWTKSNLGIFGGAGNDTILGGAGADDLRGDAGDDVLEGNGGNDTIRGDSYGGGYSSGNDTLRGGAGNDTLYGDSDADGGNGNDILDGGDGSNSLVGFDGANFLVITGTTNSDILDVQATSYNLNSERTDYSGISNIRFLSNGGDDQVTTGNGLTVPVNASGVRPRVEASRIGLRVQGAFSDPGANQTWTGTIDLSDGQGPRPLSLNADKTFAFNLLVEPVGDVLVRIVDDEGNIGTATVVGPPRVEQVTQVGGTGGPITAMSVRFTRSILAASFTATDLTVSGPSGAVAVSIVEAISNNSFLVTFAAPLQRNGAYSIVIGPAITDLGGTPMAAAFNTTFDLNIAGPRVTSAEPIVPFAGAIDGFQLSFSKVMDAASLQSTAFQVLGPNGAVAITGVNTNGSTATLSFARQTAPGNYRLTIQPTVRDSSGIQLDQNSDGNPGQPTDVYSTTASNSNSLAISFPSGDVTEGTSVSGTVTRIGNTTGPITVQLTSSAPGQLTVPASVVIPDGSSSVSFIAVTVNDGVAEKNEAVTITATSLSFQPVSTLLTILDDDIPNLSLVAVPSQFSESAGANAARVTVTRDKVTDAPLTVRLSSSDTTEASVPGSVFIPANQASAEFFVTAVEDLLLDGAQTITLTARGVYPSCGCSITAGAGIATVVVTDDEASTVSLSFDRALVAEGGTATGTVNRNSATDLPLAVSLSVSDATQASVPATITIPAGQVSATFALNGLNDNVPDGRKSVTVTASAINHVSTTAVLAVTDVNVPDLVVSEVTLPTTALTREYVNISYKVANQGLLTASGTWTDRVVLSANDILGDADDVLVGEYSITATVPVGLNYGRTVPVRASNVPGDYRAFVVTDFTGALDEGVEDNNRRQSVPISVQPAYTATVETDTTIAVTGTPIVFRGVALRSGSSAPAQFETVSIHIEVRGTRRTIAAITDSTGRFTATWQPIVGEAGLYSVSATHPEAPPLVSPQDTFTLVGLRASSAISDLRVLNGGTSNTQLSLQNLGQTALTGLRMVVLSQPTGVTLTSTLPQTLAGDAADVLELTFAAADGAARQGPAKVRFVSTEGASAELTFNVTVAQREAKLVVDPAALKAGMVVGQQTLVEFNVTNDGSAASGPIEVRLPQLTWLSSTTPVLPSLASGETRSVTLQLRPSADMVLTEYTGWLVLAGTNTSSRVDFAFRAVSESVGSLRLKATDEYSYYAEGKPNVVGATVELADPFSGTIVNTGMTDSSGTYAVQGILAGFYAITVRALKHETYKSTIQINVDAETSIETFLPGEYVDYTWTVTPSDTEQRTQISVETTFETNVPAPVLTVSPGLVDLNNMDWSTGPKTIEYTITNNGLIRADNVKLSLPTNPIYIFAPVVDTVPSIPAKSSITVPVLVSKTAKPDFRANLTSSADSFQSYSPAASADTDTEKEWLQPVGVLNIPFSKPIELNTKCSGPQLVGSIVGNLRFEDTERVTPDGIPVAVTKKISIGPVEFMPSGNFGSACKFDDFVQVVIRSDRQGEPGQPQGIPASGSWTDPPNAAPNDNKPFYTYYPLQDDPYVSPLTEAEANAGKKPIEVRFRTYLVAKSECFGPLNFVVLGGYEWGYRAKTIEFLDSLILAEYEYYFEFIEGDAGVVQASMNNSGFAAWTALPADKAIPCIDPVGVDDDVVTCQGKSVSDNVLTNDKDKTKSKSFAPIDRARVTQPPKHGQLQFNEATGDFTYTPDCDFVGYDYFVYRPLNGSIEGCETIVTIEVRPCLLQGSMTYEYECGITIVRSVPLPIQSCFYCANCEGVPSTGSGGGGGGGAGGAGGGGGTWYGAPNQCSTENIASSMEASTAFASLADDAGVCARVRIRIDQNLITTRSSFDATLEITNRTATTLIESLGIDLSVKDTDGNDVTDLFGVRTPKLTGLNAVDGTGIVNPNSTGRASWVIVPTAGAALNEPKQYTVGGTLRYRENGVLVTINLFPAPITVLPSPILDITYFHQRDVFSDDPFTDVVEPAEPYTLAVMIHNDGKGEAKNVSITSAQPKIIENEKGLLADFRIIGTEVEGQNLSPSLTANFGTITPDQTSVGKWLMTSTIQGLFIDYQATVTHVDAIGDKKTSTVGDVAIRELIHVVRATDTNGSSRTAFLTNDIDVVGDNFDLPDTLYVTDNTVVPVAHASSIASDGSVTAADRIVSLTAAVTTGWNYLRVTDPGNGQYRLARVVRSDGVELPIENFWQTDRTFIGQGKRPIRENILHVADKDSTGSYTLYYEPKDLTPPVLLAVSGPVEPAVATAVDSVDVKFSRAIDLLTFTTADLELTRNGATIVLPSSVIISDTGSGTYRIARLASATAADGMYKLSVRGAGVNDPFGVNGFGTVSAEWDMASAVPAPIRSNARAIRTNAVASISVTFTRPANATLMTVAAISLTRDGSPVELPAGIGFSQLSPRVVQIDGLTSVTQIDGAYALLIDGSKVKGTDRQAGRGTLTVPWKKDSVRPFVSLVVADQSGVTRTQATNAVITFSESIVPSSLTLSNISLTRNGAPVATTGLTISAIDDRRYSLSGLAPANNVDGDYVLTINGTGLLDAAGNRGTGRSSTAWSLDRQAPDAATELNFVRDLGVLAAGGPPTSGTLDGKAMAGSIVTLTDLTTKKRLGETVATLTGFAVPVDLLTPGNHSMQVRVTDAAGNSADALLQIFIDPTPLAVERIDGIPSGTTVDPVDSVDIVFSKSINATSFTLEDLELTRDNGSNLVDVSVLISPLSDRAFRVLGLRSITTVHGLYRLAVRVGNVIDTAGVAGRGEFTASWVQAGIDFGDLADTYGTTTANGGAQHALGGSLYLGSTVTPDLDGLQSNGANLDMGDDGVVLPTLLVRGMDATFIVTASQFGRLDAFIDFDGNGSFAESERITPLQGQTLEGGANKLKFFIPREASAGNYGARFRVSTLGGLGPAGRAEDGEVEDYRISIFAAKSLTSQIIPDPEFLGKTMMYVVGGAAVDRIQITQVADGVRATINGLDGAILKPTSRVTIFSFGGKDNLRMDGVSLPGFIDGGAGDDIIRGGEGDDLLYGRGGNDVISGGDGIDLIYGGSGEDKLYSNRGSGILFGEGNNDLLVGNGVLVGGSGDDELLGRSTRNILIGGTGTDKLTGADINQGDILIAGYTSYDENVTALLAMSNEWAQLTPVLTRISHLNGSAGGGLNGSTYLDRAHVILKRTADTITNFGANTSTRNDWVFMSTLSVKPNAPGIVEKYDSQEPPANPQTLQQRSSASWNNNDQPSDVNGDGLTTPLDALLIINRLNQRATTLGTARSASDPYFDASNDGALSPLDALLVINELNAATSSSRLGEVEATISAFATAEGEDSANTHWDQALMDIGQDLDSITLLKKKRLV